MDWTRIVAMLALVATLATAAGTVLGGISPEWGGALMAIGAGITAFCGRIQGTPVVDREGEVVARSMGNATRATS